MGFCSNTASIWQLVGKVFFILKIVIPLLLIIFSIVNFSKVALSGDDKAMNDTVGQMIKKLVLAVVIFLIPTVVKLVFDFLGEISGNNLKENTRVCINCLTDPYNNCDVSKSGGIFKR